MSNTKEITVKNEQMFHENIKLMDLKEMISSAERRGATHLDINWDNESYMLDLDFHKKVQKSEIDKRIESLVSEICKLERRRRLIKEDYLEEWWKKYSELEDDEGFSEASVDSHIPSPDFTTIDREIDLKRKEIYYLQSKTKNR